MKTHIIASSPHDTELHKLYDGLNAMEVYYELAPMCATGALKVKEHLKLITATNFVTIYAFDTDLSAHLLAGFALGLGKHVHWIVRRRRSWPWQKKSALEMWKTPTFDMQQCIHIYSSADDFLKPLQDYIKEEAFMADGR